MWPWCWQQTASSMHKTMWLSSSIVCGIKEMIIQIKHDQHLERSDTSEVTYSTKAVDLQWEFTGLVTYGQWDHSSCVPMQNTLLRGQFRQSGFYMHNGQAMIKAQQNITQIKQKKTLYIRIKKHTFLNYSIQDKRLCKQNWLLREKSPGTLVSSQIHEYGVTQIQRSNPLKQEGKEVTSSEIGRDLPVVL